MLFRILCKKSEWEIKKYRMREALIKVIITLVNVDHEQIGKKCLLLGL